MLDVQLFVDKISFLFGVILFYSILFVCVLCPCLPTVTQTTNTQPGRSDSRRSLLLRPGSGRSRLRLFQPARRWSDGLNALRQVGGQARIQVTIIIFHLNSP